MRTGKSAALLTMWLATLAAPIHAQEAAAPIAKPIGNPGTWIPDNAYPAAARASAEQGRVGFTLQIDEAGRVNDCTVTSSSGSPLLDETTCNLMTANGRFTPARDKKNRTVAGRWSSSVRWKLEVAPPEPPATPAPAK